jgi:hypothetical protein
MEIESRTSRASSTIMSLDSFQIELGGVASVSQNTVLRKFRDPHTPAEFDLIRWQWIRLHRLHFGANCEMDHHVSELSDRAKAAKAHTARETGLQKLLAESLDRIYGACVGYDGPAQEAFGPPFRCLDQNLDI